mgnify:CR=1 FL=1
MSVKKRLMIDMDDVICTNGFLYMINKYLGSDYTYDDFDDFIYESKKTDYSVVYVDDAKMINRIQKDLKSGEVIMNDFPFDTYKFKISK